MYVLLKLTRCLSESQVRELERGAASVADAQLTSEKSPAVQQIEISAREEERARWKVCSVCLSAAAPATNAWPSAAIC